MNYLEIAKTLLSEDTQVKKNRTGVDTFVQTPKMFQHNMQEGFPLLTTKKMAWKTICVELEGFIGGITDKKWYQDRGCRIWDEWANPQAVKNRYETQYRRSDQQTTADFSFSTMKKKVQAETRDLGPIYGWQWRRFNQDYSNGEFNSKKLIPLYASRKDQLAGIIRTLREDPNNRRLVVSSWNPTQAHQMALPPCHYSMVFQHINGTLSLNWSQRSCDYFLGVPFNIASYALLLELVAKQTLLKPFMLTGNLVDVHLYENHVKQMKEQISREPYPLPKLIIPENFTTVFDWTHKDVILDGYKCHPALKGEVAV